MSTSIVLEHHMISISIYGIVSKVLSCKSVEIRSLLLFASGIVLLFKHKINQV